MAAMTIPITIVGGYLGAGKTTLVNHLLRHANGLRLGVLVNEFGELPIDADLIEDRDGNVLSIAGGCVCCSYGSDLMAALAELAKRTPPPEHVILETSGVALPGAVAASVSLIADYELDGIVVVADADTIVRQGADRYVGDTITRQLEAADLVLLNKSDLVPSDRLEAVRNWIAGVAPRARIVTARHGAVSMRVIVGAQLDAEPAGFADRMRQQHTTASYATLAVAADGAYRIADLATALSVADTGLLRAKGFVRDVDGACWLVQMVGTRVVVSPAPVEGSNVGRLVCIGLAGQLSSDRIGATLDSARVRDTVHREERA